MADAIIDFVMDSQATVSQHTPVMQQRFSSMRRSAR
jgi:hypothetical protein